MFLLSLDIWDNGIVEVIGSIPISSTTFHPKSWP